MPADDGSLPKRFFREARRVLLKEQRQISFDAPDILRIAEDPAMQAEFKEIFRSDVNNPQLGDIIVHFLENVARDLESKSKVSDIKVDLIDRAGMTVAASVTVAGISMALASAAALGPILLLAGGITGLGLAGTGRTLLRLRSHNQATAAAVVRGLISGLGAKR